MNVKREVSAGINRVLEERGFLRSRNGWYYAFGRFCVIVEVRSSRWDREIIEIEIGIALEWNAGVSIPRVIDCDVRSRADLFASDRARFADACVMNSEDGRVDKMEYVCHEVGTVVDKLRRWTASEEAFREFVTSDGDKKCIIVRRVREKYGLKIEV